ncbi:MAG: EAL domain-containing protein [Clostridia bacterium]|nr:EAL domain-containing protein [Clostridia bacterium]
MTAEGIETGEMAKVFTEIGCDYLQGYCYSKPIPMDEFLKKYGKE